MGLYFHRMDIKLRRTQKVQVKNTIEIVEIMQEVLQREDVMRQQLEHLWIIGLNNVNKILYINLVYLGYRNCIDAIPPDIFRMAIHKMAMKIIMVHNSSSEEEYAPKAYQEITDRMIKVGEIINIPVLDHIVIFKDDFFSYAGNGIIHELGQSSTWRIMKKEDVQMQQVHLAKSKREGKLEVAKKMKDAGLSEAQIKALTGLRLVEIRRI